jgi:hypothetical protein
MVIRKGAIDHPSSQALLKIAKVRSIKDSRFVQLWLASLKAPIAGIKNRISMIIMTPITSQNFLKGRTERNSVSLFKGRSKEIRNFGVWRFVFFMPESLNCNVYVG